MQIRFIVLVPGLLLLACVTPYQPRGLLGGYEDARLAPGVHLVTVSGNGYTRAETLAGYALTRGKELCQVEGYPRVRMVDPNVSTSSYETPTTYTTTGSATNYGGTTYGTATTRQSGGDTVNKHSVSTKAVCMSQTEFDEWQAGLRERLLRQ